jgi:hypothetical protein
MELDLQSLFGLLCAHCTAVLAFKEEKGRQEKILLNTRASFQGVKIL